MKTIIFDGCAFAVKKEKKLKKQVLKLKKKRITPKLVTILVGNDPASEMYVRIKKKAAERIGCEIEIVEHPKSVLMVNDNLRLRIISTVKKLNNDKSVHGIMLQMPLPENFSKKDRDEIINYISKEKDVDGLRDGSFYLTPTVKSVIYVLKEVVLLLPLKEAPCKVVVVGYTGFEGRKIYRVLKEMGYKVIGVDSKTKNMKERILKADILISVTGSTGLIKESMVKEGCTLIDIGAPDGDIENKAYKKASFISPVPGGIGPVTILSLLENLVESAMFNLNTKKKFKS